jgi:hypothetical protein
VKSLDFAVPIGETLLTTPKGDTMILRTATNRMACRAAARLRDQGVAVPLPALQRLIERTPHDELTRSTIPPEVTLDTRITTRHLALSTAMDLYKEMESAKSDAQRAVDAWKGPKVLEQLYRMRLRLLPSTRNDWRTGPRHRPPEVHSA